MLGSLLSKIASLLIKVAFPVTKNILAAASAINAAIQKKIHGSGTTSLITSNREMDDIIKIVQALEDSNILFKIVSKTCRNETREQKGGFLEMLFGTLGASLLGNIKKEKEL